MHKTQEMSATAMKCVLRINPVMFLQELAQTFDKKNQQLTAENQKLANSVYLSECILDLSSWRLPFQTEVNDIFDRHFGTFLLWLFEQFDAALLRVSCVAGIFPP